MKVLVTGAAGFVGSHVARRLVREGCDVCALVRSGGDLSRISDVQSQLQLLYGDVRSPQNLEQSLRSLKPDLCIHLAWYANPGEYLHARENVDLIGATVRLATMLADLGCHRFVGVGTCFEYATEVGYLSESTPLQPKFLYSAAKAATFMILSSLPLGDMTIAWARLFYLFGPQENERRLVPSVIRSLSKGQEANCTLGEQIRDFLHVEDVASALWAIAQSPIVGPVNVGSGSPVSVATLVTAIGEIMGRSDLIRLGALPYAKGDPPFVCANTSRLQREAAWRPSFGLFDGLKSAIEWWRAGAASSSPEPPRSSLV